MMLGQILIDLLITEMILNVFQSCVSKSENGKGWFARCGLNIESTADRHYDDNFADCVIFQLEILHL